jgi:hypothetical protein
MTEFRTWVGAGPKMFPGIGALPEPATERRGSGARRLTLVELRRNDSSVFIPNPKNIFKGLLNRDKFGDLQESWFILFSNETLNTHSSVFHT